MMLLVDFGNTRTKWLVVSDSDADAWAVSGENSLNQEWRACGYELSAIHIAEQISKDLHSSSTPIVVASVKPSVSEPIVDILREKYRVHCVVSESAFEGLVNAYSDPTAMGIDRWLAMIAGYRRSQEQSFIVVDCGTAITLDAVLETGQHMGGFILPGLNKQLNALLSNTEQVHSGQIRPEVSVELGQNTQACVFNGIVTQIVALIEKISRQLSANGFPKVILTGGDGELIKDLLIKEISEESENITYVPLLVFEGLLTNALKELKKM